MTRSGEISHKTRRPTVTFQLRRPGEHHLWLSATGDFEVRVWSEKDVEKKDHRETSSKVIDTGYGSRIIGTTPGEEEDPGEAWKPWNTVLIRVYDPWEKIEIETEHETDFYSEQDELIDTGKKHTYYASLWNRPVVKAGVGIVAVAVGTGIVGKLLDWW